MKMYGYYEWDQKKPVGIQEVTIEASSDELEKLAEFFTEASKILKNAESADHIHYLDFIKSADYEFPDIIVYKS